MPARAAGEQGAGIAELLRGRRAQREGDAAKAERHFRAATTAAPQLAEGYRFLSHVMLQRGERREVEGVLWRLIELAPEEAEAHHNLGGVLLEQGRAAEAVVQYQEALRLRPDYPQSRQMLQEALRQVNAQAASRPAGAAGAGPPRPSEGWR